MLQNAYFLAKIGADTAENEQHFAEILPKIGKIFANFCAAERTAEEDNEALEARLAERTAELNSSVESLSVRSAQQVPPRTRRVVANFW